MTFTFGDKKSVKDIVKDGLDQKLGPKLEKVEELITKSLDKRLGPRLENVGELVKQIIFEDKTLVKKDDIKHLPTKKEFFDREDKIMGELKAVREEITLLSDLNRKVNDQEERIEKVEANLDIQPVI